MMSQDMRKTPQLLQMTSQDWHKPQSVAAAPLPRAAEVQLWWMPINVGEAALSACLSRLSPLEQASARRFKVAPARSAYIASRLLLRHILSHALACAPDEISYTCGAHGKPALSAQLLQRRQQALAAAGVTQAGLVFNLSHSAAGVLCVLATEGWLGVDLEQLTRSVDVLQLAQRFFAPQEYAMLLSLKASQRQLHFLRLWTLKEAFVKAIGLGLSYPLADFSVAYDESLAAARLTQVKDPRWASASWKLMSCFMPGQEYLGAFAYAGPFKRQLKLHLDLSQLL